MPSFETSESLEIALESALGGGLASIGVSAFKKSVYAVGGVMGVRKSASCLITADMQAEMGVEHISEGNEAVRGVCSGGRTGFVTAVGDMFVDVAIENE